jgi:hypothetical protein
MRFASLLIVLIIAGCGEEWHAEGSLHMSDGKDYALSSSQDALGFICASSGTSALSTMANKGYLPTLTLAFSNATMKSRRLAENAGKDQLCDEIIASTLGNTEMEFTFQDFSPPEKAKIESGGKAAINYKWVSFIYRDGAMKTHTVNISLRCETAITSSCLIDEDGSCTEYSTQPPRETCTFRAPSTLFTFSNHKEGVIDISGEIDFARNRPSLSVTKLSVIGYY